MGILQSFMKNQYDIQLENDRNATRWRSAFVSDYPIESILQMSISEYVYTSGIRHNRNTFCSRIMDNPLASFGAKKQFPNFLGIYLKQGTSYSIYPYYKKLYNNDCNNAFEAIKKDIYDLLIAAQNDNLSKIENCKLEAPFKSILLAIYYPDKYMPIVTKTAYSAYGRILGFNFHNESSLEKNLRLVDWKNKHEPYSLWSGWLFMIFLDSLWNKADDSVLTLKDGDISILPKRKIEYKPYNLIEEAEYTDSVNDTKVDESIASQYVPTPEARKEPIATAGRTVYPRDPKQAAIALQRADHLCEFYNKHMTFTRKRDGLPYTEAHHLIPMQYQHLFDDISLDVPANIVSLCSLCHNIIHYAVDNERNALLNVLYNLRKDELSKVGISITLDELKKMYD